MVSLGIRTEVNAFHQLLDEERKKRKDMHSHMINTITQIQRRINAEVENERKDREETQESLIKLLEDT